MEAAKSLNVNGVNTNKSKVSSSKNTISRIKEIVYTVLIYAELIFMCVVVLFPVVWIVGGTDKGNDYSSLVPLAQEKVKAIICMGLDNTKIHEAFENVVPQMYDVTSAKDAVQTAHDIATAGDVVLLSPCCASFDLFKNYEDRGRQFKDAVRSL